MIGNTYKVSSGVATVSEYHGNKYVVVRWESGHTAVVQKDALEKGLVFDGSTIKDAEARKVRMHKDAEALDKLYADIEAARQAAEAVRRTKAERAAAERAEKDAMALTRKLVAQAKARARETERQVRQEAAAAKLKERRAVSLSSKIVNRVAAVVIDESKPRKGVVEVDFKDRAGFWVLRFSSGGEFIQTRLGKLHNNMTQRARAGGSVQDVHSTSYKGVGLSDTFADPQKFCDWVVQQRGWGLGWQLDKDLLATDNRQYSESNCVFLPRALNTAIVNSKEPYVIRALAEAYKPFLDPRAYAALSVWEPK